MITLTHTIRCKSSLSLSFNHHSHLFNDTFERYPLLISSPLISKCTCYCCCYYYSSISICNRLAPINPSFLCKKLIFSGNNFRVLSFYDVDRSNYYEKVCAFKEKRKNGKRGFGYNKKKQFLSNVNDECGNDVEVMLSLLTDEVVSEYIDVRDRKKVNKVKKSEVKIRALAKSKNLDLRKEGCFGELKGEKDFEVKCDGGLTSSSEYKNDLKRDCKSCIDEVVGNMEKREACVEKRGKLVEKEDTVKGNNGESICVSRDWRKTSEKKLNGQSMDEVDKNTDEVGSRMKYKRSIEMSNNDKSVIELAFSTEKKLNQISEVSESRMKRLEEKSTEVSDALLDTRKEKHHNENEKSQHTLGISDTNFTNNENTSISHRKEFRMAKQKQCPAVGVTKGKKITIEDNIPSSEMISVDEGCGPYGPKGGGSRHSSQGSGPKGPSDEMWHVIDASTQYSTEPDNIYDLSENGEAVKASSRSFWTVIGDVVRLNWKSSWSESYTPNSGTETWFSSTKTLDSPLTSSNNNSGPSISTSLPIIKESSGIKKTSLADETGKSGNDPNNGELKERRLVHKDQVSKDRFDEWEDAYNLENEQRKNDEMFMREALLEAKKAADVWEVPVGAVLVKGGKIIARGYNLVEELRDSTAHAEMICIRKASTNLQSWRLSDTTLYVTLEPCPMCAGAILQARIDTVVWGAPNKLLGADGSWIRLFCDGNGVNDSMPTNKPSAPTHPFHPNMTVRRGVLAADCVEVMKNFFRLRRKMKTEPKPEPPTPPSSISVSHHHHSNFLSKIHHAFKIIFCL